MVAIGFVETEGEFDFLRLNGARALEIAIQDQHTDIIDLLLCRLLNAVTLSAPTVLGSSTVNLVAGHGFTIGDTLCLRESQRFYQSQAINVVGNVLTMGSPLDFAYTVAANAERRHTNMNVNGSATPVVFSITPPAGTEWDITRMIIQATDDAAMDDGKFAGIAALTRGLLFRVINGHWKNIFNATTNGDFRLRSFDVQYLDATLGPGGLHGFGCRRSFNGFDKNGVVIRLGEDDEFQVVVQDDLTAVSSFRVCIQGHVVD